MPSLPLPELPRIPVAKLPASTDPARYVQVQAGLGRRLVWLYACAACGCYVHDRDLHLDACGGAR